MSYLYSPAHPSIIRMLRQVVREGKKAGKPVAVCGEVAADPRYTPLLLGLGIDELSMAAPTLPMIKSVIRRISMVEAQALTEHILTLKTYLDVEEALEEFYNRLQT